MALLWVVHRNDAEHVAAHEHAAAMAPPPCCGTVPPQIGNDIDADNNQTERLRYQLVGGPPVDPVE